MIRIGLNWYTRDKVWVNIVRNILCPMWFDFQTHTIDINLIPIISLVILYFYLR